MTFKWLVSSSIQKRFDNSFALQRVFRSLLLASLYGTPFLIISVVCLSCIREFIVQFLISPTALGIRWLCWEQKIAFTNEGRFIIENIVFTRMQMYEKYAYITLPRYKPGVPFTLGRFSMDDIDKREPVLEAFPSWDFNDEQAEYERSLKNVVDIVLDKLDNIWILDVGIVNTLTHCPKVLSNPTIYVICAKTSKLLKTISLAEIVKPHSRLQYLAVYHTQRDEAFAFISDAGTRSIIVWDTEECAGYRAVLPEDITCKLDVLYMALVHPSCKESEIYFTYLSGELLYKVDVSRLILGKQQGAIEAVGPKTVHLVIIGTDNKETIFFRLQGENDIYMWNVRTKFSLGTIILVDESNSFDCRQTTHVVPGYRRLMWALESNFVDFVVAQTGCLGLQALIKPLVKFCEED